MGRHVERITLFRNTQDPLIGSAPAGVYKFPGSALTANNDVFYADLLQGKVKVLFAAWHLVWDPVNLTSNPCGVRLIQCDNGPSNITQITEIRRSQATKPKSDSQIITEEIQDIIDTGIRKQFAHQTFSNGKNPCKIYGSWVNIVYEDIE